jgi:hypothetical protein
VPYDTIATVAIATIGLVVAHHNVAANALIKLLRASSILNCGYAAPHEPGRVEGPALTW